MHLSPLNARIRRTCCRRVAGHVLDVWPRRSVVVLVGAAALRVSLADATGASHSSPSADVDLDDRAGSAAGPVGVQDDEASMCWGTWCQVTSRPTAENFCGAAQGLRSTFSCGAAGVRGLGGGWTSLMWWLWDVRRRLSRNAVGAHV